VESVNNVRYEKHAETEFLVAEKESVMNIHKCLCSVYGSATVVRNAVGLWAKSVMASESSQADLPRSGHPVTAVRHKMLQPADAIVREDRCFTNQQLELSFSISKGSVNHITRDLGHSNLGYVGLLGASQSNTKLTEKPFLPRCWHALKLGETFLSRIVTAEESRLYHVEPETKRHYLQSPRQKKFKKFPPVGKVIITVSWD
jgi:hypothetical protein